MSPKTDFAPETRQQKAIARRSIFDGLKSPIHHYLGLFGSECWDVIEGKERKMLVPGITELTGIERDTRAYQEMSDCLCKLWSGYVNELHLFKTDLHRVTEFSSNIDYAFLDFLGSITWHDADWIRNILSKNLSDNAHVAITIAKGCRANQFIPEVRQIAVDATVGKSNIYFPLLYSMRSSVGDDFSLDDLEYITFYYVLCQYYLFKDFTFDFEPSTYCDSQPMFLFKLSNIKRVSNLLNEEINKMFERTIRRPSTDAHIEFVECNLRDLQSLPCVATLLQASDLINGYNRIKNNKDRIAWDKVLEDYCASRSKETGKPAYRFQAAIKARIRYLENKKLVAAQ